MLLLGFAVAAQRGAWVAEACGLLALLFVGRQWIQGSLRTTVRAALLDKAVRCLVVASPTSATHDDEYALVADGVQDGQQLLAADLPSLAGDALVVVALGVALVAYVPLHVIVIAGLALAGAFLAYLPLRPIALSAVTSEARASLAVHESVTDAVGARLEIAANGVAEPFCTEAGARLAHPHAAQARLHPSYRPAKQLRDRRGLPPE